MSKPTPRNLDLRTATSEQVNAAMARGVFQALRAHKQAGKSVVVWRDGRVETIPPERIEVPDDPGDPSENPETPTLPAPGETRDHQPTPELPRNPVEP